MTEFHVDVVRIGEVREHPNADRLEVTTVHSGYPCVIKKGQFTDGDLAVYVPIDTTLPDTEVFSFLSESDRKRLKAKRLRGIFSMGLLVPALEGMEEGDDVAELLGVKKYEPPIEKIQIGGDGEKGPDDFVIPKYTDIEPLRRNGDVLVPGERVTITEKIHGANARFVHDGTRLWAGSRQLLRKQNPNSFLWQVAKSYALEEVLARFPMKVFYGEAYGKVQDLHYGVDSGVRFAVFDVFDIKQGKYLDYYDMDKLAAYAGLPTVPLLFAGEWDPECVHELAEGASRVDNAKHVREGFVVRPHEERFDERIGRVILKMHGQGYLLRRKK